MAATESKFRGVAVDVGNSALHLGWFDIADGLLGEPAAVFYSRNSIDCFTELSDWVRATLPEPVSWAIATVNDPAAEKLHDWLATNLPGHDVRRISHCDCPIPIRLAEPQNVGVDRLMACVAAFELCGGQPAVVIDAGTAVTVDLLAEGAFQGGAILPGMRMSASALDRYTEKLPYIETVDIDAPEPIGKSTANAMKSGMFWGTVGAIRELTERISQSLTPRPRIFLTGGDGRTLAPFLSHAEHVPHMVLRGIATTAAGSGFANG